VRRGKAPVAGRLSRQMLAAVSSRHRRIHDLLITQQPCRIFQRGWIGDYDKRILARCLLTTVAARLL